MVNIAGSLEFDRSGLKCHINWYLICEKGTWCNSDNKQMQFIRFEFMYSGGV